MYRRQVSSGVNGGKIAIEWRENRIPHSTAAAPSSGNRRQSPQAPAGSCPLRHPYLQLLPHCPVGLLGGIAAHEAKSLTPGLPRIAGKRSVEGTFTRSYTPVAVRPRCEARMTQLLAVPRGLPFVASPSYQTCPSKGDSKLAKPEERGATEREALNLLGPTGPEILGSLRDELAKCLPDDEDRDAVLSGLVRAVVAEEVTRQTITKQPMIPGLASNVDKAALISQWKCLAEHYRGSKQQQALREGAEQLEGLESDVAIRVIHDIRRQLTEVINWSMERTAIRSSLKIPFVPFARGRLQVRGPRVAFWKLRSRLLRLGAKVILWLAAISGIAHWILWVFFDQLYLIQHFPGVGKVVQFILISCTSLFAWGFARPRKARRRGGKPRLISPLLRSSCWGLLASGWVHWILWVFFRIPDLPVPVEPIAKMGQAVFLMGGIAAAYALFRQSDYRENDGD